MIPPCVQAIFLFGLLISFIPDASGVTWRRHAIDNTSQGADGVRLADVNQDGLPDVATGWEEGGLTRIYLHPGTNKVRQPWPQVTVGQNDSPEDAVWVDLDLDGRTDVVTACEGKVQSLFIHWAPPKAGAILDSAAWKTDILPLAFHKQAWMFVLPLYLGKNSPPSLLAGGKNAGASLVWMVPPPLPRNLNQWTSHELFPLGWIMTLRSIDMDGDGDLDILFSDRKGPASGVYWLQNQWPQLCPSQWPRHLVGGLGEEVMFIDAADFDGDGIPEVVVPSKPDHWTLYRAPSGNWTVPGAAQKIPSVEPTRIGRTKAVRLGDINGDGILDLVFTCEGADAPKSGVGWLDGAREWRFNDISGPEGVKFDRIELVDLDQDGDLDVMTCEERDLLGVIWYENPL